VTLNIEVPEPIVSTPLPVASIKVPEAADKAPLKVPPPFIAKVVPFQYNLSFNEKLPLLST